MKERVNWIIGPFAYFSKMDLKTIGKRIIPPPTLFFDPPIRAISNKKIFFTERSYFWF